MHKEGSTPNGDSSAGVLRDIDVMEVVQALRDTNKGDIALAALFVACGYFTLTFYDLFALRTIGRTDEEQPVLRDACRGRSRRCHGHAARRNRRRSRTRAHFQQLRRQPFAKYPSRTCRSHDLEQ